MDNAFGDYDELNLVHTEDDSFVASIRAQGAPIGDFVYYGGLRGPIKIWDVTEAAKVGEVVEGLVPKNEQGECYACLDGFWERI